MLRHIWPVSKLYQLSERVYSLQENIRSLERKTKELESINAENQKTIIALNSTIDRYHIEIEKANKLLCEKGQAFDKYKKETADYDWYSKYGYDWMIADLQMSCVEALLPGNRERLLSLKNTHQGESCFIIGNGPSLKAQDLEALKNNHIFSFASKRINLIYDQTSWRPDIWGASDLDYIETNLEEIKAMSGYKKLLCAQTITRQIGIDENAIYYPFIQVERRPPWFNADVMRGVHFWGTITCKLINIAVYMGFSQIYLLGVDNTFPYKRNKKGEYVCEVDEKNHFSDKYYDKKYAERLSKNIDDVIKAKQYMDESYRSVKWHCDSMGVSVVNATRGGELEIFPRMEFERVVEKIKKNSIV